VFDTGAVKNLACSAFQGVWMASADNIGLVFAREDLGGESELNKRSILFSQEQLETVTLSDDCPCHSKPPPIY